MRYYIIRIYRRDDREQNRMTGLVETVGRDTTSVFNSPEELWRILRGRADRDGRRSVLPAGEQKRSGKKRALPSGS